MLIHISLNNTWTLSTDTVRLLTLNMCSCSGLGEAHLHIYFLCPQNKRSSHLNTMNFCCATAQHLGKKKKFTYKILLLREHDCNEFLHNEVSVPTRARYSFSCFSSYSNSWFWWCSLISMKFKAITYGKKHFAALKTSYYS